MMTIHPAGRQEERDGDREEEEDDDDEDSEREAWGSEDQDDEEDEALDSLCERIKALREEHGCPHGGCKAAVLYEVMGDVEQYCKDHEIIGKARRVKDEHGGSIILPEEWCEKPGSKPVPTRTLFVTEKGGEAKIPLRYGWIKSYLGAMLTCLRLVAWTYRLWGAANWLSSCQVGQGRRGLLHHL